MSVLQTLALLLGYAIALAKVGEQAAALLLGYVVMRQTKVIIISLGKQRRKVKFSGFFFNHLKI